MLFRNLFSGKNRSDKVAAVDMPALNVPSAHYIVGDIHGRYDLLQALLGKIVQDAAIRELQSGRVIYLGDYVDRGDQSAQVLGLLFELCQDDPELHTCMMGNHEAMMLQFLDDPVEKGARWIRFGGLQTLASFGIGHGINDRSKGGELLDVSRQLRAALPAGMEDWLRAMPTLIDTGGNLICVHAGLDPSAPLDQQTTRTRLWGHGDFMTQARTDGVWVAHGHTVVDRAGLENGRVQTDTGAYATGTLSAVGVLGADWWVLAT